MHQHANQILAAGRRAASFAQFYAALWFLAGLALPAAGYTGRLTSVLLLLSTFLFAIVTRYSARYLLGDPAQPRFLFWLSTTGTFVFGLVLVPNLLLFAAAWCGISLSLHQLLQFYRERPGALAAARKKFLISRLGDLALLAALILTYRTFGTWQFDGVLAAAAQMHTTGTSPATVDWIAGLLAFAALLKSAQFPFHSWLPDTMETPTPVSALMHAGIINAGGILLLRLSPLVALSDIAMVTLCAVGGFTAVFASTVMLTQTSIKRCLAFSTVAQMGFMMLECGLGAFHMALLHLVAHSLYKAHAFLSSGSAVQTKALAYTRPSPWIIAASVAGALGITFACAAALGFNLADQLALNAIFAVALAQVLWSLPNNRWQLPLGVLAGAVFSLLYFTLETTATLVVRPIHSDAQPLGIGFAAVLLLVAILQSQLPRLAALPAFTQIYVHARNGFYLNTLANRVTTAVWPAKLSQEEL